MNIYGHKLKAKLALRKANYWENKIEKYGVKAKINFKLFSAVKKWHHKKIIELKNNRGNNNASK